jgi:hypothetical protein
MSTLTINEGFNPHTGVAVKTHFDSDEAIVIQKTWDAQPHLEYAARARAATEGQRWGEGKLGVHLPPVVYGQLLMIKDPDERKKFVRRFAQENPKFVMFERYLKG